jgi:hypothetical protein
MKTLAWSRAVLVGSLVCGAIPIACGDTDENPPPTPAEAGQGGEAGSGGSGRGGSGGSSNGGTPEIPGISDEPQSLKCGTSTCLSVAIPLQQVYVDPCCAGPDEDTCGVETGFLSLVGASFDESCQAKAQEGPVDAACPTPEASEIQLPIGGTATLEEFPGCCRAATGTCGVMVNDATLSGGLTVAAFGLGCVDASPFFPGEAPVPCGAGSGGEGGAAAGGAGGVSSGGAATGGAGAAP